MQIAKALKCFFGNCACIAYLCSPCAAKPPASSTAAKRNALSDISERQHLQNALTLSHSPTINRRLEKLSGNKIEKFLSDNNIAPFETGMGAPIGYRSTIVSSRILRQGEIRDKLVKRGWIPEDHGSIGSWEAWGEAYRTRVQGKRGIRQNYETLHLGMDLATCDDALAGLSLQLERMDGEYGPKSGHPHLSARQWMAGPYFTVQLNNDVYLDVQAKYGRIFNDVSNPGAKTENTFADRWMIETSLLDEYSYESIILESKISLRLAANHQSSHVNNDGTQVPSQIAGQGDITFSQMAMFDPNAPGKFDLDFWGGIGVTKSFSGSWSETLKVKSQGSYGSAMAGLSVNDIASISVRRNGIGSPLRNTAVVFEVDLEF